MCRPVGAAHFVCRFGVGGLRFPQGRGRGMPRPYFAFCFNVPAPRALRLSINPMNILRTIGRFVGNGLDRSVLPRQKHDMARKPRAIRRDFMRCARPDVRMGQDPSLQIFRKPFGLRPRGANPTLFIIYYLLSLIYFTGVPPANVRRRRRRPPHRRAGRLHQSAPAGGAAGSSSRPAGVLPPRPASGWVPFG